MQTLKLARNRRRMGSQMDQAKLRPLAAQAIPHWKAHLPKMYARLKEAGALEQAALDAAQQTMDEKVNLMHQGIPEDAAWEMVDRRAHV